MKKEYPIKSSIIFSFILILSLCMNSCSFFQDDEKNATRIPVFQNLIEQEFASNLMANIDYISLETKENCIIGEINKIIKSDSKYYILDAKSAKTIFVFNDSGKFLYTIGKYGKGPGEYTNITDFAIDADNNAILIIDNIKKIIKTDLHGNFLFERAIPNSFRNLTNIEFNNETILAYSGLSSGNQKKFQIVMFDEELNPIKWLLPYEYPFPGILRYYNTLYTYNGNINFVSFSDNCIYKFVNDTFEKRYIFDLSGKELSLSNLTAESFITNTENSYLFRGCVESDKLIYLPIFDQGRPKVGFLEKKTNKFYTFNKIVNDSSYLFMPYFYSRTDGKFISAVSSPIFLKIYPDNPQHLKATDNPVIVEYNISLPYEN